MTVRPFFGPGPSRSGISVLSGPKLERVSVDSAGTQGNDWSVGASITPDARFVAFHCFGDSLVGGDGLNPSLSADRSVVAFESEADLVPDDPGFAVDVFVHAHS